MQSQYLETLGCMQNQKVVWLRWQKYLKPLINDDFCGQVSQFQMSQYHATVQVLHNPFLGHFRPVEVGSALRMTVPNEKLIGVFSEYSEITA